MTSRDAALSVRLGFLPSSQAIPDDEHPGLLRAGPRAAGPYGDESVEFQMCSASDGCRDGGLAPDLLEGGFDVVDLTAFADLQQTLTRIAAEGRIADEDAPAIRSALDGATLRGSSGVTATVLHIADEGLIMRAAGPNGRSVVGPRSVGMNGHGGATSVHADQDVFGTPLTQLMDSRAPSLFRHDSPDGHNDQAGLMLVNMWIPLHQITQPLALADGRSIDRRRHQLRYGLATSSFLERDDEMVINDIWRFLHDSGQRWYLRSEMDHRDAYLFNTLSTPHGASTLPGEEVAERCYDALVDAESAVAEGRPGTLVEATLPIVDLAVPVETPPALRGAVVAMSAIAGEAARNSAEVCGAAAEEWTSRSSAARRRVVRSSVELRMVISIES